MPACFVGRDEALQTIHEAFSKNKSLVAITALHGLRGVGKTVVAAAYAHKHRNEYSAIWWIAAHDEIALRSDFISLGIRMGWIKADDKDETAIPSIMEQLSHTKESLLLVFDNAPDANGLWNYLPQGGNCRILVTSNWDAWRKDAAQIKIDVWDDEVGASFLIARTGRTELEDALSLSKMLGGLPLALEQAAAYCEVLGLGFAEYSRRYVAASTRILDDSKYAPSEYYNHRTVVGTFTLAISAAAKRHPGAEPLILYAALLALDPVPIFVFTSGPKAFGELSLLGLDDDDIDEAIATLRAFALVEREMIVVERSAPVDAIRMHRLVREVAASKSEGEHRAEKLCKLIEAMAIIYPNDAQFNPSSSAMCAPLTPHVLATCDYENLGLYEKGNQAALLDRVAGYFNGRGAYYNAEPIVRRALAIIDTIPEYNPHYIVGALSNLAFSLSKTDRLAEAEEVFTRILSITEHIYGTDSPLLAIHLNNLAVLYSETGRWAEAENTLKRVIRIDESSYGPEDPRLGPDLLNLATVVQKLGRLDEAETLYRRTLLVLEGKVADNDPDFANILNNFATLLAKTGRQAEAETLYRKALSITEAAWGAEHPSMARDLNNLAHLLEDTGKYSEAETLFRRSIDIKEKTLGPKSVELADTLASLGVLLFGRNRFDEAETIYRRAIAIWEAHDNPYAAKLLLRLARRLREADKLDEAEQDYRRAMAVTEQFLGTDHEDIAECLGGLGGVQEQRGDLAAAKVFMEQALALCEKTLGPNHPTTAIYHNNLALVLHRQRDLTSARKHYLRCLDIIGTDHPNSPIAINNLIHLEHEDRLEKGGDGTVRIRISGADDGSSEGGM